MTKRAKIAILTALTAAIILLMPFSYKLKDGGSTVYRSLTYTAVHYHRLNEYAPSGYDIGWKIEILGFVIRDDCER